MTHTPVVAIIGGGLSGAAIAYHLAQQTSRDAIEIIVIEPRETLGGGLAYSSHDPAHRINVPAAKMTMVSAKPEHFKRWLIHDTTSVADSLARTLNGDDFPQRSVFGRYVHAHVEPLLRAERIQHIRTKALDLTPIGERYAIVLADGNALSADIVVIATTHPLPSVPLALQHLTAAPRFVADPYAPDALNDIRSNHAVLIVGTGLTAADIIASLDRRGHSGPITALSRHGYRSRGHAPTPADAYGTFGNDVTARSLLQRVRQTLELANNDGWSWHTVVDALRDQAPSIWDALPIAERRRVVRHLRSLWDVHRFRIAPQVEAVLERRLQEGNLSIIPASLRSAVIDKNSYNVSYKRRFRTNVEAENFDAIVITTGPAHTGIARESPLIGSLFQQGLLARDPVGLGLHTAKTGHVITREGKIAETIYIGGPLARGTFGELMGVPEVTRYAECIAEAIAKQVGQTIASR